VSNSHRLIIIVKPRTFDEAVWKRLLVAYAYALYDRHRNEQTQPQAAELSEGGRQ
jgi:hypothetical protein